MHMTSRRKPERRARFCNMAVALCLVAAPLGAPRFAAAEATTPVQIDLPAQSLRQSLLDLANRTGVNIIASDALVAGLSAGAVSGVLTAEEAVAQLLSGTGLSARASGSDSLIIETSPDASSADDSGALLLNELTVTARRFEETLQDVPGSVFVLPDVEIERSNITDLDDIFLRTPNVNVVERGSPTTGDISIRGISNQIGDTGTGPTNGIYVDEIILNPTGRRIGTDPALFDLERVEVLYGPQGTTFGRGTIGGAINYVTKKPTAEFEASLEAELGSDPDGRLRGVINGAVLGEDLLNARLSFFGQAADGYFDTPNLDEEQGLDSSDYGVRLALRSQPTSRLTLDLTGSYERNNYTDTIQATLDSIEDEDLVYLPNEKGDLSADRFLTSFRAEYDTGFGTATSLTSFFMVEDGGVSDGDISALDALTFDAEAKTRSIAQEFRFNSATFDVPVLGQTSFILGTNFSFNRDETTFAQIAEDELVFGPPLIPFLLPVVGTNTFSTEREISNFAVFGDAIFEPVEGLEFGVGARFTVDRVKVVDDPAVVTGNFGLVVPPGPGFSASETFSGSSPKGSVKYDWTDNFSTYVVISTGYRSGGFNALAPTEELLTFDEEKAINYEGGFRSSWLDGDLSVNASAFAIYYKDMQVFTTGISLSNPVTVIQNAAKARSLGAEISIQARPVEGLFLGVDYGLAKTKYIEFVDELVGADRTGQRLPNAPTHTLNVISDYSLPVLDDRADAFLRGEYSYTSTVADGDGFQDRHLINLRSGLRAENYEVEVFVENLFDEVYRSGSSSAFIADLFGRPRHGEVGKTRRFGIRGRILF
ncbi:MAG: TonB-dependent receptor [Pseudomonadota bacterium]